MQIISFMNMKGGVGKTTLAVNIAYALAELHQKKVLMVDGDPQFNATQCLLFVDPYLKHINDPNKGTLKDVFVPKSPGAVRTTTGAAKPLNRGKMPLSDCTLPIYVAPFGKAGRLDLLPSRLSLVEVQHSRRQTEARRLPADPRFGQRPVGDGLRLDFVHDEGKAGLALAVGPAGKPARRDAAGLIVAIAVDEGDRDDVGQLGLLGPDQRGDLAAIGKDAVGNLDRGDGRPPAWHEADHPLAFDRIEGEGVHQHLDLGARAHRLVADIADDHAEEARYVDIGEADAGAALRDQRGEVGQPDLAGQPMAERPERAITPRVGACRPSRIGPRVPRPDGDRADHPPAIDGGDRIVAGTGAPVFEEGLDTATLDQVVARAPAIVRECAFGGFRVVEDVRLVGALVDRRDTEFREPDRLRLRRPHGRRSALDTSRPVEVLVQPPIPNVLCSIDPRLAVGAVGDRRARLGVAVGVAGVEPVEILTALDVRLQIGPLIDRGGRQRIEMGRVPPVGERHVEVDADKIDVRVCPERVEVEEEVAAAVVRLVAAVVRPVGGVADLHARAEDGLGVVGEVLEPVDRGEM
ncbi:MAG: AAA family ATPase, partial [Rhizobiales bacterium]|nr:AAA family ATPase [Hyphomicrobiales bacterium]